MVNRLIKDLGVKKIAVLYQDDSFGLAGYRGVRRALERRNLKPAVTGVYPRNTTAVKTALLDIRRANPGAVVLVGAYKPVASFIAWARHTGFNPIFVTLSFVGSNALVHELGPAGVGIYVTQVVPFPTTKNLKVAADYRRDLEVHKPGAVPSFVSLEGYMAGRLTIRALELCGREPDRACLLEGLRRAATIDLGGFKLRYGKDDNQGSDAVFLTRHRKGRPLRFDRKNPAAGEAMKSALKILLDMRYKISTQLYLSIGAAASLTVIASVVAWVSFAFVGGVQNRVNEGTVPFLASAFGTAQHSSALVAAAPRLAAVVNPDNLEQIATEVANDQEAFEKALAALIRQGGNQEISLRIKKLGDVLIENLTAIKRLVLQRFDLTDSHDTLQLQLTWVRKELSNVMVPAIDDQLFFAMTGFSKIDKPSVPREQHFSEEGINLYRYIAGLRSDATIAAQLLATAFSVSDAALLEPLRERFEATVRGIRRRLDALGKVPVRAALEPLFEQMIELSNGEEGGFNLRAGELALERKQGELLSFHESLEAKILAATETLVSTARKSANKPPRIPPRPSAPAATSCSL